MGNTSSNHRRVVSAVDTDSDTELEPTINNSIDSKSAPIAKTFTIEWDRYETHSRYNEIYTETCNKHTIQGQLSPTSLPKKLDDVTNIRALPDYYTEVTFTNKTKIKYYSVTVESDDPKDYRCFVRGRLHETIILTKDSSKCYHTGKLNNLDDRFAVEKFNGWTSYRMGKVILESKDSRDGNYHRSKLMTEEEKLKLGGAVKSIRFEARRENCAMYSDMDISNVKLSEIYSIDPETYEVKQMVNLARLTILPRNGCEFVEKKSLDVSYHRFVVFANKSGDKVLYVDGIEVKLDEIDEFENKSVKPDDEDEYKLVLE